MTTGDPNASSSPGGDIYNTATIVIGDPKRRDGLIQDLPALPTKVHSFRDPRHDLWRQLLEEDRIVILSSYKDAADAAAYSLVQDAHFSAKARKAFFPAKGELKDRVDLDIYAVAEEQFLGETAEILLIAIDRKCILLESLLADMGASIIGSLQEKLRRHGSHVIVVVKHDLIAPYASKPSIACFAVSHIRYLLEHYTPDRAEELEKRVQNALALTTEPRDSGEVDIAVEEQLAVGVQAFLDFLAEWERTHKLPLSGGGRSPIALGKLFPDDAEMHRAAIFVATYFPEVGQKDFKRLVLTLLAERPRPVEQSRQVVGSDGVIVQESWSDRWMREADRVLRECNLRRVTSSNGTPIIDFSDAHLRRELRTFLDVENSFYVDEQCEVLQRRGMLFALDLSAAAVEALVKLFVDRAVVDPAGVDLPEIVQSLRIQFRGAPAGASDEEILAWLFEQATLEAQWRAHFYGRLALLIREMLDREPLRRLVRDFFEYLIAAGQHRAVLGVILGLARRLRFAPHFDPLYWMRRLLDQGSASVKEETERRLITLARDSGPRIYEYLAVIRTWLPDPNRSADRFSMYNRVALAFPFRYCQAVAATLSDDQYGQWPSQHPLFYALPTDPEAARDEIRAIVEWILDARGEQDDDATDLAAAEKVRMAEVADLVEHWAAVLTGRINDGKAEGRAVFRTIFEELDARLSACQRDALKERWERRKGFYVTRAAMTTGDQRTLLIHLRVRVEQLRQRF